MAKPITTIEVISTVLGLVKTGVVVLTMAILEFAKIEKARAKLNESKAKNDLEIEKVKNEKDDNRNDVDVIDDYLASKMLQRPGDKPTSRSN